MPVQYAKLINKEIFGYLWGKKYEPIRRETLYKPKIEGGLSLINVLPKSRSILISSFIKIYFEEKYGFLAKYYCFQHLQLLLNTQDAICVTSNSCPAFYKEILKFLKKM